MKIEIEVPEGYEAVKTDNGFKFVKVDQEKKWEEIEKVSGIALNEYCDMVGYINGLPCEKNRNVFPTQEEANAYGIVLPQLLQWRNKVNGDWKADWKDSYQRKWVIRQEFLTVVIIESDFRYLPLHFKTREIAEQFLKDHKTLINELIL